MFTIVVYLLQVLQVTTVSISIALIISGDFLLGLRVELTTGELGSCVFIISASHLAVLLGGLLLIPRDELSLLFSGVVSNEVVIILLHGLCIGVYLFLLLFLTSVLGDFIFGLDPRGDLFSEIFKAYPVASFCSIAELNELLFDFLKAVTTLKREPVSELSHCDVV
jgi:hypothetical protein